MSSCVSNIVFLLTFILSILNTVKGMPPMKVAKEQIRQCFDCWTESWNNGDMDGYLDGYLDSPQTRYVSGKKVFRGKENIVENLKSRGGPKGVLSLLEFEVELMADCKDALCFGQYQLVDGDETHNGCFTVHVRKIVETEEKEGTTWKMVSDHSS